MRNDEDFNVAICEFEPGKVEYFTLEGLEKETRGPNDSLKKLYERFFEKLLNEHFSSYIKEEQEEDQNIDMTYAVNKFYSDNNPRRLRGRYNSYVEKVYNNLGLAVVTYSGADFEEDYGCIDATGKLVIPRKYQVAMDYGDGLFATYNYALMGGYIDTKGETVIPFRYLEVGEFKNGYAWVVTYDNEIQYIDKTGRPVIRLANYNKNLDDEEKIMRK